MLEIKTTDTTEGRCLKLRGSDKELIERFSKTDEKNEPQMHTDKIGSYHNYSRLLEIKIAEIAA